MGLRLTQQQSLIAILKVYGLNNLRVIDASIMPTMLSANLHSGTTMIGEKGSDLVLGKTPLKKLIYNINVKYFKVKFWKVIKIILHLRYG